jgi:1-acyl-sn-glycerol-3-phosphate acyltransferase
MTGELADSTDDDSKLTIPSERRLGPDWAMNLPPWRYGLYRLTRLQMDLLNPGALRVYATGREHVPRSGPFLLLPNHTSFWDPFLVSLQLRRPAHYMASAQALKGPFGAWLKALGAFPKVKYVKDRSSMKAMTELYEAGQVVTIFPEGRRSWDGHTQPLLPGIGRTVKRMGARVVVARMTSTYLFQPRWATWPRWVPNLIEYEPPVEYPSTMSAEEITADIQRRMAVVPRLPEGYRVAGTRMAEGLSDLLWACPRCFSLGGVEVTGPRNNHILCRACGMGWELDLATRLLPADGGEVFTAGEAWRRIVAHFGDQPVQLAARQAAGGVVLYTALGTITELRRDTGKHELAHGPVQLTETRLSVRDGAGEAWGVDLADLVTVSVEVGNRVQLRTADALFQLDTLGDSVLKWGHFIKRWRDPDDPIEAG